MSRQSRTAAMVVVVAATAAVTAAPASATVRVGTVAHAALARRAPPVSPGLRLHIAVTLRPRDAHAIAAYAQAVTTPGDADYRHFLTPAGFRRRFAVSARRVKRVRRRLRALGLRPGLVSAGGLSIPVTAPAGAIERAFSISLRRVSVRGRRATAAPALDAAVARSVQGIVGLDTVAARRPLLVRGSDHRGVGGAARDPRIVTGGPQPCAAAAALAPLQHAYTADAIASAYGFSGLYQAGDTGAGTTIALYELEPFDRADVAGFQACYGTHASVSAVRVDGGAGTGSGGGEAALDIENTVAFAPGARVLVYQGPNSNSGAPGSGPYDIFSAIVNQDRAQVVSVSWGECEAALGAADAAAENTLFQQAAIEGQSIVSASGDSGAQDCDVPGQATNTDTAVDDPGSQPWVVSVGGTSLRSVGPPPSESAWNEPSTAAIAGILTVGASGGGVSALWPLPSFQSQAAGFLGVARTAGRACERPGGSCRGVPDVAGDADPTTGYQIYWNGTDAVAGQPSGWQAIGGTSATTPVWGALLALADSFRGCADAPLGFAAAPLYRAASSAYRADFHDVVSGNNDFTQTNGGQFAATNGYDLATGLGSPNAAALVRSMCADVLRLPQPATQISVIHNHVSLRVHGSTISGHPIRYSARGLPPGLRLASATGVISGTPTRRGDYIIHVTGRDDQGARATTSFQWSVTPPLRFRRGHRRSGSL